MRGGEGEAPQIPTKQSSVRAQDVRTTRRRTCISALLSLSLPHHVGRERPPRVLPPRRAFPTRGEALHCSPLGHPLAQGLEADQEAGRSNAQKRLKDALALTHIYVRGGLEVGRQ